MYAIFRSVVVVSYIVAPIANSLMRTRIPGPPALHACYATGATMWGAP